MRFVMEGRLVVEAPSIDAAIGEIAKHFALVALAPLEAKAGDWVACAACGDDGRLPLDPALDGTDIEIMPESEWQPRHAECVEVCRMEGHPHPGMDG